MFKRLFAVALVFGMASIAPPAFANGCALRKVITDRLSEKYNEALSSAGLQTGHQTGTMLEIWTSNETGPFTVLVTHPTGVSCVVATGEDYFNAVPAVVPPGIPG